MDRLPVETWTRIFALACVDGGCTGCALSETNKYFRSAVLPIQVHNVALIGTQKMSVFLHEILAKRTLSLRRVQHLFLAQSAEEEAQEEEEIPRDVVQSLLQCVGPTLRTLTTLYHHDLSCHDSVLRNPLPRLEELTMHGNNLWHSASEWQAIVFTQAELVESFPSLRYLNLLSGCDSTLLFIPRAPKLTHLRLADVWPYKFSYELCTALINVIDPNDTSLAAGGDDAFPAAGENDRPTLESLTIVLNPHVVHLAQSMNITRLGLLVELKNRDKGNIVTLVESPYDQAVDGPASKQVERQQWEERIRGEAGCWRVSEEGHNPENLRGQRRDGPPE